MSIRLACCVALPATLTAAVLCAAAPARTAPTKVSWPVFISVKAAAGAENDVRMGYEQLSTPRDSYWANFVRDSAGMTTRVTEPPTCYPIDRVLGPRNPFSGKAVVCPDGTSQDLGNGHSLPGQGEDFRVLLGDRSDRFDAAGAIGSFEVHGGSGSDDLTGEDAPIYVFDMDGDTETTCFYFSEDELYGDRGDDRLRGESGPDLLSGGGGDDHLRGGEDPGDPEGDPGAPPLTRCPGFGTGRGDDTLLGGPGNDVLWARDGDRDLRIDCGPGRDKAILDRQDPKPRHCETVRRARR